MGQLITQVNLRNHFINHTSDDMKDIIKPLQEHFDINCFVYHRIYSNREKMQLNTHPEFFEYFLKHQLYQHGVTRGSPDMYHDGCYLMSDPYYEEKFARIRAAFHQFNLGNQFIMIKKNDVFCEIFMFLSDVQNQRMNEVYLNYVDLLEKFIVYFKQKAHALIEAAEKCRYFYPTDQSNLSKDAVPLFCQQSIRRDSFLENIQSKRYQVKTFDKKTVYISSKSAQCLSLLAQGCTAKSIAKTTGLSHRTVETYVKNLKQSLSCYNKAQLLEVFQENRHHFLL